MSVSPSSASSCASSKSCGDVPSTSDAACSAFAKADHSSPALARSVPSSHEAQSPSETASSREFVYFTAEMANRAVEDIEKEKEKFDTLLEWHIKRRQMAEQNKKRDNNVPPIVKAELLPDPVCPFETPNFDFGAADGEERIFSGMTPPSTSSMSMPSLTASVDVAPKTTEVAEESRKTQKRKMEEEEHKEAKLARIDEVVNAVSGGNSMPTTNPPEVDPLRRIEMMNARCFNNTSLADVVESSAKKDERTAKLEKLEVLGKQVEEMHHREDMEMAMQNFQMQKMQMQQAAAGQQPFPNSQFPPGYPGGAPGAFPAIPPASMAGPFSAGPFPSAPYPVIPGPSAMPSPAFGHPPFGFPPHGFPPGYPMSAPSKMAFPSPYPGGPMSVPGAPHGRMQMTPQMMQQMYAAQVAAQMQKGGISPGAPMLPGQKPSPAHSPFPGAPGMHPAAFPHQIPPGHPMYQQMMMNMKNGMAPSPFGYPGMNPAMMAPMPQQHHGVPPNAPHPGMLMFRPDGSRAPDGPWAPQLTPCYPPSFPTQTPATPHNHASTPSSALPTPNKLIPP